jgi:hypothetical protein
VLNACSATQISDFITACASTTSTPTTCSTWTGTSTNSACYTCIFPSTNAGAVVADSASDNFNVAGCIALTDTSGGTACAQALQPLEECDDVACTDCFSTSATAASIDQCESAAETGACASYLSQTDSSCANDFADGGAANTCSTATYILNLFCGTGG